MNVLTEIALHEKCICVGEHDFSIFVGFSTDELILIREP